MYVYIYNLITPVITHYFLISKGTKLFKSRRPSNSSNTSQNNCSRYKKRKLINIIYNTIKNFQAEKKNEITKSKRCEITILSKIRGPWKWFYQEEEEEEEEDQTVHLSLDN